MKETLITGAHLNPIEKETLIKRYIVNPGIKMNEFCEFFEIPYNTVTDWEEKIQVCPGMFTDCRSTISGQNIWIGDNNHF